VRKYSYQHVLTSKVAYAPGKSKNAPATSRPSKAASYRQETDDAADAAELILYLRATMVYRGRAWWKLSRVGFAIMDRFWSEVASWNV
jgi:hypothetical protein